MKEAKKIKKMKKIKRKNYFTTSVKIWILELGYCSFTVISSTIFENCEIVLVTIVRFLEVNFPDLL